jgi:hypothetical protein
MDKLIEELERLTQLGLIELPSMTHESLSEFMEQRGLIIDTLLQFTPEPLEKEMYTKRIHAILSHDDAFIAKMEHYKEEAKDQLSRLNAGRTQRNSYTSEAYDQESFYFDKKK